MAGKGSLEYRGGTFWRLIVSCGLGTNGRQVKKTRTVQAKDEDDAKSQLEKFLNEVDGGIDVNAGKISFERFVKERWLPKYAEKELAPKTIYEHRCNLEKRIYPAMGHLKMNKIRPSHIIDFIDNMGEEGMRQDEHKEKKSLSSNSILRYFRLISSILSTAVQWQVIPENPAKRVKPPKVQKQKAPAYDEVQTANLLKALETVDLQYKVIVILGVALGVRRGELMGLEWKQHIDLKQGIVKIEQASQYLPGEGIFRKNPKNESSERIIALPKSVIALLEQYKAY
jgi:integrase